MPAITALSSFLKPLAPKAAAAPAPAPAAPSAAMATDTTEFAGRAAAAHWAGTVGGREVRWDANDLTVKGATGTFSLEAHMAKRDDLANTAGTATVEAKLLAAVGDYVSVRESWETFFGLYPQTYTTFGTLDMRTGEPVKLTDLFPAADVRAALLADPAVQRAMREKGVRKPATTLEGLLDQLAGATIYGSRDRDPMYAGQLYGLEKFALHSVANGKVGVRVVLDQPGGNHHALPVQLGLLLPVPPALREALTKAAAGKEGILMERASRIGATTSIDYAPIMPKLPE